MKSNAIAKYIPYCLAGNLPGKNVMTPNYIFVSETKRETTARAHRVYYELSTKRSGYTPLLVLLATTLMH